MLVVVDNGKAKTGEVKKENINQIFVGPGTGKMSVFLFYKSKNSSSSTLPAVYLLYIQCALYL